MPSRSFSEMIDILKKLVSFMNMTVSLLMVTWTYSNSDVSIFLQGSATGLDSIRHIVKYLESL
jgi:hypothetical protein